MRPRRRGSFLAALFVFALSPACGNRESTSPPTPSPVAVATAVPTPDPTPRLYAWANPLGVAANLADHTWVTSFPAASSCPPSPSYWYSWGGCHATGPGTTARPLATHEADLAVARCIATPDLLEYLPPGSPSHGGIDLYGIDGVCHQLSNRILWATTKGAGDPSTVDGAKGYGVSRWLYGTYGANVGEWQARITRCMAPPPAPAAAPGTPVAAAMMRMAAPASLNADLAAMVSEKLGPEVSAARVQRLVEIRQTVMARKQLLDRRVRSGQLPPRQFAEDVNALVAQGLRQASEVLTPDEYQKLFGLAPGETIGLVDPEIAEKSRYRAE